MKNKETLEEVAFRLYPEEWNWREKGIFKQGAKWQQERMYSEEEVIELLTKRCEHFGTSVSPFNKILLKQDLEWFNEFKKK
jgi:hypothetical protein